MLSRLLWGGRMTLVAGLTPVLVAFVVGAALGVMAGYVGGITNTLIMRTMDIFYAFPAVLLRSRSPARSVPDSRTRSSRCRSCSSRGSCAVAESATVQVKGLEYIAAARASGAGVRAIVRHHLLANVLGPILVFSSTQVSLAIILAAGLFLPGARRDPPAASGADADTLRQSIYVNAIVPRAARGGHSSSRPWRSICCPTACATPWRSAGEPLLRLVGCAALPPARGVLQRTQAWVRAVDDVSFEVAPAKPSASWESPAAQVDARAAPPEADRGRRRGREVRRRGRARRSRSRMKRLRGLCSSSSRTPTRR